MVTDIDIIEYDPYGLTDTLILIDIVEVDDPCPQGKILDLAAYTLEILTADLTVEPMKHDNHEDVHKLIFSNFLLTKTLTEPTNASTNLDE